MTYDCVSPNVKLLMQYVLYHLSQDSKIFPLARVHQYTSGVLSAEVPLTCYGRRARLSPRAMVPSPSKKNSGLAKPRWRVHLER